MHEVHAEAGEFVALTCGPGSFIERLTARNHGRRVPWECVGESARARSRDSRPAAAEKPKLAHLVTGKALGDPARRRQSAEVGHIERRIPFGEVDDANARIGGEPAHGVEEVVHRHPPGPATRSGWKLRPVDHVNVAVDHQRVAVADMIERAIDGVRDAALANVADGDDEVAGLNRIFMHCAAVSEAR